MFQPWRNNREEDAPETHRFTNIETTECCDNNYERPVQHALVTTVIDI